MLMVNTYVWCGLSYDTSNLCCVVLHMYMKIKYSGREGEREGGRVRRYNIYMLRTNLKPAARFKAVQTGLKTAGPF